MNKARPGAKAARVSAASSIASASRPVFWPVWMSVSASLVTSPPALRMAEGSGTPSSSRRKRAKSK